MANLGTFEIKENGYIHFNLAAGTYTGTGVNGTQTMTPGLSSNINVNALTESNFTTPRYPRFTFQYRHTTQILSVFGQTGSYTPPTEVMTITESPGQDTISFKVVKDFTPVDEQEARIVDVHLAGPQDTFEVKDTTPYFGTDQAPPFIVVDRTVATVEGGLIRGIRAGTTEVQWGNKTFNLVVQNTLVPIGYNISPGCEVRIRLENIWNHINFSRFNRPGDPVFDHNDFRNPQLSLMTVTVEQNFGSYVSIQGDSVVISSVGKNVGIGTAAIKFQRTGHSETFAVQYFVIFNHRISGISPDYAGQVPTEVEQDSSQLEDKGITFPIPTIGFFSSNTLRPISFYEDLVDPPQKDERPLYKPDGDPVNPGFVLPGHPRIDYKKLAFGVSSKNFIDVDASFEDERKINQTATTYKEGGHYDFARTLPKRLRVIFPHDKRRRDNDGQDGPIVFVPR